MDKEAADTDLFARSEHTLGTVFHQTAAQPLAVMASGDGKPRKDHDRNWIGHVTLKLARRFNMRNRAGGEGIVGGNLSDVTP